MKVKKKQAFESAAEKFLDTKTRRQNDRDGDKGMYERYLKPLHRRHMNSITGEEVTKLLESIKNGKSRQRGKRTVTANHCLRLIRSIYKHAGTDDPTRLLHKEQQLPRNRYLDADELKRFFKAVDGNELFLMALFTGARLANLKDMCMKQIDNGTWHKPMTKSGQPHSVPLVTQAVELLDALPFSQEEHYPSWRAICKKAKLHDMRLHDARRTLATWMFNTGASEVEIAAVLGHVQKSITSHVYTSFNDSVRVRESLQRAVTKMCRVGGY